MNESLIELLRIEAGVSHGDGAEDSLEWKVAAELERLSAEVAQLRAELAACMEDAERYRWLRNPRRMHMITVEQFGDVRSTLHSEALDAAIDAARKETKG